MVMQHNFLRETVVSTRIRLARNLAGFPFSSVMKDTHAAEILHLVSGTFKEMSDDRYQCYPISSLSEHEKLSYQEGHLVSPLLLKEEKNRAVILSSDKKIAVMVNEEDHLREQYISKGFNLRGAYQKLSALDNRLSGVLDFAYDQKLGYLTACPSNLGTGMRASVMVFLPGLTCNGGLKKLLPMLREKRMTLRGAFGEGSHAEGYLYQLSNEQTLGVSEMELIERVSEVTMTICDQEVRAREEILKDSETELRDRCLRAYGTLTNCALLDMEEFRSKIIDVRLGIFLKFFEVSSLDDFDAFLDDMQPATFCINNNLEGENERFYDEVRAEAVGSTLRHLMQVARNRN